MRPAGLDRWFVGRPAGESVVVSPGRHVVMHDQDRVAELVCNGCGESAICGRRDDEPMSPAEQMGVLTEWMHRCATGEDR